MGLLKEAGLRPVPYDSARLIRFGGDNWAVALFNRRLLVLAADRLWELYEDDLKPMLAAFFDSRQEAAEVRDGLLAVQRAKLKAKASRGRKAADREAINRSLARIMEAI